MNNFNLFEWLAMAVLIVGGINWGLISLFDLNLVSLLFGELTIVARTVYALVGVSALYFVFVALLELGSVNVNRVVHP